jgi:cholestenol delta-isomerase
MQIIICVAHLYGVAIYYSTSLYELLVLGIEFSRPEPLYFWGYFAGFNIPWVIVPASKFCALDMIIQKREANGSVVLLLSSVRSISRALQTLERMNENFKKMDETLKKGSLRGRSKGISNPKWKQTI